MRGRPIPALRATRDQTAVVTAFSHAFNSAERVGWTLASRLNTSQTEHGLHGGQHLLILPVGRKLDERPVAGASGQPTHDDRNALALQAARQNVRGIGQRRNRRRAIDRRPRLSHCSIACLDTPKSRPVSWSSQDLVDTSWLPLYG